MKTGGKIYREIVRFFDKRPSAIFKIVAAYKNVGRVSVAIRSGRPKVGGKRIINTSASGPFFVSTKNSFTITI